MWLRAGLPFAGCFIVTIVAAVTKTCNPKSCNRDANSEKSVCGSNGLTFPNRCVFEKARCQNKNMTLIHRGPCKQQRACLEWDSFLQNNPQLINSFNPNCRSDGSYESTQCHKGANFCWCVTPEGLPLPYTSYKLKPDSDNKQRCERKKKSTRRSPTRKHKTRKCKRREMSILNNNLINSFHSEFKRESSGRNDTDTVVVMWKFQILDRNNDQILDKSEYKDLKKLIKKALRPKRCAKHFPLTCDINKDALITLQEWDECLAKDGMDEGHSENTSNENGEDSNYYEDPFSPHRSPPHGVLSSVPEPIGSYDEDSSEVVDDPTDCLSDRKTALDEGYQLYIPECTGDGRYQKVQCYKSAGYCWCVNEDTGKNIPGTSVKNETPNCDHLKTSNKSMKGCPDDKKLIFLQELLEYLHTKMSEIVNGNSSFNSLAWIASKEEQAATWSFVVFDKNKNKMLERNEWKTFKEMVAVVKGLRKCGKKLPRYCDSNKDRQISMTEWLECLNIQQGVGTIPASSSLRMGPKNPLSLLKDD